MQQNVFEKLFEKYLNNSLSEKDNQQLMEIIEQGTHDDFIKEKIDMILKEKAVTAFLDEEKSESILKFILAESSKQEKVISLSRAKKSNRKTVHILFTAAAAAVIVFFAANNFFFYNKTAPVSEEVPEKVNSLLSYNGKQLIHLPDGSTIVLNENSSIQYDQSSFDNKTREVTLSGEAYFDIKHNDKKPFIVHTGKIQTRVLGTAFNINARNSSENIEVTVTRGKVQVGDTEKIYGVITPNQQIKVNKNTLNFEQNNISAVIVTEWKSNYLILDDINMEEAVALISKKYKVHISLANEKIKNCRIMASFLNEEDLEHVLKVISSVTETEYRYNKDKTIILYGKGCE